MDPCSCYCPQPSPPPQKHKTTEEPTRISSSSSAPSSRFPSSGRSQPSSSRSRGCSLAGGFLDSFLCWRERVFFRALSPHILPEQSEAGPVSQTQGPPLCSLRRLPREVEPLPTSHSWLLWQGWDEMPRQNVGLFEENLT